MAGIAFRKGAIGRPVMMASISLVLLFIVQPFMLAIASDMPSTDGGTVVPMGSRATYYGVHPRLLVRDKSWAGGLSVSDLGSRCQVGSQWWTRCNILETNTPNGTRQIPTYAMRYLLKGNNADADQAIVLMKAVPVPTAVYNLTALADLALGFDWVYNYTNFSPADKTTIINKIDAVTAKVLSLIGQRHIWSKDMAETGAIGLAGLALEGHHANADKYVNSALENSTLEMQALDYSNGTWPEGLWYLNTQRLPLYLEFLEAYRTATEPSVDLFTAIKNNYHDWLRKMLYFNIYCLMPYGENARMGDTATGQLKYYFRQNLDLMVSKTQDPAGADYLNLIEAIPSASPTYSNDLLFKFVLWYDPNVPTGGLKNLPKAMLFGPGTYDYLVVRTGWGPKDEVMTFVSGDGFSHHQHLDQGSFTLTRGEPLIIDSGANRSEGTDHRENYYTRTVAHDSMNIRLDGEGFITTYFAGWAANDGGQRIYSLDQSRQSTEVDSNIGQYLASKNNGPHFETGNIVDLNVRPDYVYVQGDYTQAYNNAQYHVSQTAKVSMVTRQMVLLAPDWLVVKDRVLTPQSYFRVRSPLPLVDTPTVNGTVFSWDEGGAPMSDGNTVTVQGKAVTLYSKTVFPTEHRIIDRTGANREFWSDSTNRDPGPPVDPLAGIGRVDIQDDTFTQNHEFLNVMAILPNGSTSTMPPVEKINEVEVMGAGFNHTLVIFSRTDKAYTWASINTTMNGTTKVHAFDIFPNLQFPIMVLHKGTNKADLLMATSDKNGTLDFTANLTGNDQIIIGWSTTGDLSVDSLIYTPAKPNNGDNVTLKAVVKNRSTYSFTLCPWYLDFYNGDPNKGGKLMGTDNIDIWPMSTKAYTWVTNFTWTKTAHQIFVKLRSNSLCPFTDTDGTDNSQTVSIYVNARPVPIMVAPSTAWVNQSVTFDGSQSYDLEGQLQPKKWNWGDGTPNETGTLMTHTFMKAGTFNVTLTVTDLSGVSNSTKQQMIVRNLLHTPVPYFTYLLDPPGDIGNVTSKFIFNSTSVDPDNLIEWIKWDFGDGSNTTGPNAMHNYRWQGFYNISMTIGWNKTETATAWWHWFKVANLPPHAAALVNGSLTFSTFKNEPIVFNASGSTDPDDPIAQHTFRWYFDKTDPNDKQDGIVVTHRYHRSGNYTVRLMVQEVVDNVVYSDNTTVQVTIRNRPPKANISCSNFTLEWNQRLWVDAWRSSDPDQDLLQYIWDFGDNTTPYHNQIGQHFYAAPGTYKVTLTVLDPDGASDKAWITIVQKPEKLNPPPPPPKDNNAKMRLYMIAAGVGIAVAVAAIVAVLLLRRKKDKEKAEKKSSVGEAATAEASQQQLEVQQQQYTQEPVENPPGTDEQTAVQQSYQAPPDELQEIPKEQTFMQEQPIIPDYGQGPERLDEKDDEQT